MTNKDYQLIDKKDALRVMYHDFVDLIVEFQKTYAYDIYDEDDRYEHMCQVNKVNASLQKARIDLKCHIYENLRELMDKVTNTSLEDIMSEEDDLHEVVNEKTEEFFEELSSIMKLYIYQN